jgi:hypothetical protein
MNKINLTAAGSTLGTVSYVSPEAKVTEIHSEGVLCASVQGASFEEWNEDTLQW